MMKKNFKFIFIGLAIIPVFHCAHCGGDEHLEPEPDLGIQIIADHTVIGKFDNIPNEYIREVKKMLIGFYGESHAFAYGKGLELLEAVDSKYACNISTGESYTEKHLRVEEPGFVGEDLAFTWYSFPIGSRPNNWKVNWYKNLIKDYHNQGHPLRATGFGWCSDMTTGSGSSAVDPVYGIHWFGSSRDGIDGDLAWGIDADDYGISGNRINLYTYFGAFEELIDYCAVNSPSTRMIFTTGPVDLDGEWSGENGYQGHLKHEAIRNYVRAEPSRILFDYADILCYDDIGNLTTQIWNSKIYPSISQVNFTPQMTGHISNTGAIRLAKAQWWMLARIAGWDGN